MSIVISQRNESIEHFLVNAGYHLYNIKNKISHTNTVVIKKSPYFN